MSPAESPSLDMLVKVARAFGPVLPDVVFLGGAVLPLLVTDPAAHPARGTEDVDVVVKIQSRREYYAFEETLRSLGLRNDTSSGAPVCRWIVEGCRVDVMPDDASILGFSNPWYAEALRSANPVDLSPGLTIRLVSPAAFLATKHAALMDPRRGGGDYMASRDLEDIIAVVDGRPELDRELHAAPQQLKIYLGKAFRGFMADPAFREALPAHLPGDLAGQARRPRIEGLLRRWAEELSEE